MFGLDVEDIVFNGIRSNKVYGQIVNWYFLQYHGSTRNIILADIATVEAAH